MKDMKRIFAFILAALLLLTMVACEKPETPDDSEKGTTNQTDTNKTTTGADTTDNNTPSAKGTTFVYKGVTIKMNELADSILSALGDPATEPYESPSCAFQGNDIFYNYGSIEISVYENNGERRISSLFVKDDLVSTPEGLYIGSSEADAVAVYGESSRTASGNLIFHGEGVSVTVILTDGKVSSIEYIATVEE